jgi:hypothetical protein
MMTLTVSRKAFLVRLAGGVGMLVLGGCGGGSNYSAAPAPAPGAGSCGTSIADNHPDPYAHALVIPLADLDSPVARTYGIQGAADHNHDVTFSAADLADLKAGRTVNVLSTTTLGHQHDVSERCA